MAWVRRERESEKKVLELEERVSLSFFSEKPKERRRGGGPSVSDWLTVWRRSLFPSCFSIKDVLSLLCNSFWRLRWFHSRLLFLSPSLSHPLTASSLSLSLQAWHQSFLCNFLPSFSPSVTQSGIFSVREVRSISWRKEVGGGGNILVFRRKEMKAGDETWMTRPGMRWWQGWCAKRCCFQFWHESLPVLHLHPFSWIIPVSHSVSFPDTSVIPECTWIIVGEAWFWRETAQVVSRMSRESEARISLSLSVCLCWRCVSSSVAISLSLLISHYLNNHTNLSI